MIYAIRALPDGKRRRWPTVADEIEFEVPGHGLVHAAVVGDQLVITAEGDSEGPRMLTIKGLVVNQLRVSFSKE
jgi:hypothetical protein